MRDPSLAAVDLNLLVAFDALLAERNVTRAAAKIGLSQSAMSHALSRLRELFEDPLLVRTPRGMLPTARAEELTGPIRRALEEIERALRERPSFDPSAAERAFTIATSDYIELVLLPRLVGRISKEAPGVDLHVRPLPEDAERALAEGKIDLALVVVEVGGPSIHKQRLFDERFVCAVREGHPVVKRKLSLEQYTSLPHALIAPRGVRVGGFVDDALAKLGKKRRVAVTVPHFLIAPHVVAASDLVLTLAERIARACSTYLPLRLVEPPIDVPGFSVSLFWHERQQYDPGATWLRSLITDVCADI